MKELTREDWLKNPKPRMLWVWNDYEENKMKRLVVHCYTAEDVESKFIAENENGRSIYCWKHCAEIEEPQFRRMTKRELSWWLRDHPEEHREWTNKDGCVVHSTYVYAVARENEPCTDNILIRVNGGEWKEPIMESEE